MFPTEDYQGVHGFHNNLLECDSPDINPYGQQGIMEERFDRLCDTEEVKSFWLATGSIGSGKSTYTLSSKEGKSCVIKNSVCVADGLVDAWSRNLKSIKRGLTRGATYNFFCMDVDPSTAAVRAFERGYENKRPISHISDIATSYLSSMEGFLALHQSLGIEHPGKYEDISGNTYPDTGSTFELPEKGARFFVVSNNTLKEGDFQGRDFGTDMQDHQTLPETTWGIIAGQNAINRIQNKLNHHRPNTLTSSEQAAGDHVREHMFKNIVQKINKQIHNYACNNYAAQGVEVPDKFYSLTYAFHPALLNESLTTQNLHTGIMNATNIREFKTAYFDACKNNVKGYLDIDEPTLDAMKSTMKVLRLSNPLYEMPIADLNDNAKSVKALQKLWFNPPAKNFSQSEYTTHIRLSDEKKEYCDGNKKKIFATLNENSNGAEFLKSLQHLVKLKADAHDKEFLLKKNAHVKREHSPSYDQSEPSRQRLEKHSLKFSAHFLEKGDIIVRADDPTFSKISGFSKQADENGGALIFRHRGDNASALTSQGQKISEFSPLNISENSQDPLGLSVAERLREERNRTDGGNAAYRKAVFTLPHGYIAILPLEIPDDPSQPVSEKNPAWSYDGQTLIGVPLDPSNPNSERSSSSFQGTAYDRLTGLNVKVHFRIENGELIDQGVKGVKQTLYPLQNDNQPEPSVLEDVSVSERDTFFNDIAIRALSITDTFSGEETSTEKMQKCYETFLTKHPQGTLYVQNLTKLELYNHHRWPFEKANSIIARKTPSLFNPREPDPNAPEGSIVSGITGFSTLDVRSLSSANNTYPTEESMDGSTPPKTQESPYQR